MMLSAKRKRSFTHYVNSEQRSLRCHERTRLIPPRTKRKGLRMGLATLSSERPGLEFGLCRLAIKNG
jgi:hypothetical protein